ncbi:MAG: phage portal protein family protein, partial [Acidimicrobiales bacterium]
LLHLAYGHMFAEKVGAIGADQLLHLTKLAPRMPRTIAKINQTRQGDLVSIEQWPNYWPTARVPEVPIPADRLVCYLHEPEGDLIGNSVLRRAFRHWTLKDRLLRVDAMMAERNGMGIPWIVAQEGASEEDITANANVAAQWRAGSTAGLATPFGVAVHILGVEGTLPNLLPSIQYHDEQIAACVLAEFLKLGTSATGARAVGDVFVDFFVLALAATIAEITETFNTQVIDWLSAQNWGPDEPTPALYAEAIGSEHQVTAQAMHYLMMGRAVTPDPALEAYVRETYRLPERVTPWVQPGFAPLGAPNGPALDANGDPITVPSPPPSPSMQASIRAGALPVGHEPATTFVSLPNRPLHRAPTAVEAASGTDFAALDTNRDSYTAQAVTAWAPVHSGQITQLVGIVRQLGNNPAELAAIRLDAPDGSVLVPALLAAARSGQAGTLAEAGHQGVDIEPPEETKLADAVGVRARAVSTLLTSQLAGSATAKAVQLAGGPLGADALASAVRTHLDSLTGSWETRQLGGAVQASINAGRIGVMANGPSASYYSSEIGDNNTCAPCMAIDGTQYPSLDAATVDYPAGGYAGCLGGPNCRGTLVAIWSDESAPTT